MHNSLFNRVKLTQVYDPTSLTTGAITSSEIDTAGFNGAAFIMPFGAIVGVLDLAIYGSTTSGGTLVAITGASATQVTGGQDSHAVAVDIYRPTYRYLKAVATVATGPDLISILAVQYDPEGLTPVTQPATVSEVVKLVMN